MIVNLRNLPGQGVFLIYHFIFILIVFRIPERED